jgi:hypothetical protein
MWHTHQLNPVVYKNDTVRITGGLFNHDDSVNQRHEGSKLNVAAERTRELWKRYFNESFSTFGAMYRGSPPNGLLYTITTKDEFDLCAKQCMLSVNRITLSTSDVSEKRHLSVSASSARSYGIETKQWFKLKKEDKERVTTWERVGSFVIDTKHEQGVMFTIHQKSRLLKSKTNVGSFYLDLLPQIQTVMNVKTGCQIHHSFPDHNGLILEIHGHLSTPHIGDIFLFLINGKYQEARIPEDVQTLFGPVPMERIPPGVDNICRVASHRYGLVVIFAKQLGFITTMHIILYLTYYTLK